MANIDKIKSKANEYQGLVVITSVAGSFFLGLLKWLKSVFESSGVEFPASLILSGVTVIVILGTIWSFHNWKHIKEGDYKDD